MLGNSYGYTAQLLSTLSQLDRAAAAAHLHCLLELGVVSTQADWD